MIDEAHLPSFTGGTLDGSDQLERGQFVAETQDRSIRAIESALVQKVLEDTNWNISKAASILGINRTTLYNKIRVYSLGQRPGRAKVIA
jgi:transcriptional regulator of acetoin/glycerol metabolism